MNICKSTLSFLRDRTDKDFNIFALIILIVMQLSIVSGCLLPESYGGKNSLPEFIQLAILVVCCIVAFRATSNRRLFLFAGFVLIFLFLREINYGRTLWFFADPDDPEKFPKWKDIPYGWLAHVFVGIYLTLLVAVFIWKKLYRDTWELLKSIRFPAWECSLLIINALCAQISERVFHNNLIEEFFELTFYTAFTCLLWRFARGLYKTCR